MIFRFTSINASTIPLGFISMATSSNTTSIAGHTTYVSTGPGVDAIPSGGTSPHVSDVGGGGGMHGAPPLPPPTNLVLNTIL